MSDLETEKNWSRKKKAPNSSPLSQEDRSFLTSSTPIVPSQRKTHSSGSSKTKQFSFFSSFSSPSSNLESSTHISSQIEVNNKLRDNLLQILERNSKIIQQQTEELNIQKRLLQSQQIRIHYLERQYLSSSPYSDEKHTEERWEEPQPPVYEEIDIELDSLEVESLSNVLGMSEKHVDKVISQESDKPKQKDFEKEKGSQKDRDTISLRKNKSKKIYEVLGTDFSEEKVKKSLGIGDYEIKSQKQKALESQINYCRTRQERNLEMKRLMANSNPNIVASNEKSDFEQTIPSEEEEIKISKQKPYVGGVSKKALDVLGHDPHREKLMDRLGIEDERLIPFPSPSHPFTPSPSPESPSSPQSIKRSVNARSPPPSLGSSPASVSTIALFSMERVERDVSEI